MTKVHCYQGRFPPDFQSFPFYYLEIEKHWEEDIVVFVNFPPYNYKIHEE